MTDKLGFPYPVVVSAVFDPSESFGGAAIGGAPVATIAALWAVVGP